MKCRCDNCGFTAEYDKLPKAKNLFERLEVGGMYSDVECPECGALCFPANEPKQLQRVEKTERFIEEFIYPVSYDELPMYFPEPYLGLLQRGAILFEQLDITRFYPVLADCQNWDGKPYVEFLYLKLDPNMKSWLVLESDLFWSGGADGDIEMFPTEKLATRWVNQKVRAGCYRRASLEMKIEKHDE